MNIVKNDHRFLIFFVFTVALFSLWGESVFWGFAEDDYNLVQISATRFIANPFQWHGRPLWALSYVLLPQNAMIHHLANLVLVLGILTVLWRIACEGKLDFRATVLLFTVTIHPAFLFGVTWLAQRNDLLVILFSLLGFLYREQTSGLLSFQTLASASKTPFVLHNLVYAFVKVRERKYLPAIFLILLTVVFLVSSYLTYYQDYLSGGESVKLQHVGLFAVLLFRMAKAIEGFVLVVAPIPAFYFNIASLLIVGVLYVIAWGCIIDWRQLINRLCQSDKSRLILGIAVALSAALAYDSQLRIVAPAAFFFYLLFADTVRRGRIGLLGIGLLLSLNTVGTALNHRLWATSCMSIEEHCQRDRSLPIERFRVERSKLKQIFAGQNEGTGGLDPRP